MAQSKPNEKRRSPPSRARGSDLADEVTQAHQAQVNQVRHEPIPASSHSDRGQESDISSAEADAERRAAGPPAEAGAGAPGPASRASRVRRGYRSRSPRSAKST
jgi:hypothetical protein